MAGYDPFAPGPLPVRRRELTLVDEHRGRRFPADVWEPDGADGEAPLVLYSHHSGGHRRVAAGLLEHLAGHGFTAAALDHSEVVAPELRGREGETAAERGARVDAIIAARVPDLRLLLDRVAGDASARPVGVVGHSFGGWTALALPDVEPRVAAVVAHAPGGSRSRRPGILPLDLAFAWGRDVPTLFLAGDADVPVPLDDVVDVYERTPASRQLVVLHGADHQHFVDGVAAAHEAVRTDAFPGDAAWINRAMRPIDELSSEEQAHLFVRGLTLAHLDATLRDRSDARDFLERDLDGALRRHGIDARTHAPR